MDGAAVRTDVLPAMPLVDDVVQTKGTNAVRIVTGAAR